MNLIHFEIDNHHCSADSARSVSLAIPLQFNGPQPVFFGAPTASATPLESSGFIGDTHQGGSCNVQTLRLTPHCNGTHTECIGHVVDDGTAVTEQLRISLLPATLVTLAPRHNVIDLTLIKMGLQHHPLRGMHTAFIIRTLPNTRDKFTRNYDTMPSAYLAEDAANLLVKAGVEHLLVDLPSLDPAHDEGRLAAHRAFWGLPASNRELRQAQRPHATITEMIYVPEHVKDGYYLLDLQIPAFMRDAAPSRPILYPLEIA